MKTYWNYSLLTETQRLLQAGQKIACGFYKHNNFIVLPYPVTKPSPNIVIFPDLPYLSINRFWSRLQKNAK